MMAGLLCQVCGTPLRHKQRVSCSDRCSGKLNWHNLAGREHPNSLWTAALLQRLRDDWAAGYSTAAIGWRLGVTKNAIVGKTKRRGLPARPSPIIRNGAPQPPRPPQPLRAGSVTLPPLASAIVLEAVRKPAQPRHAPSGPARPPAVPRHPQAPRDERHRCQWIESDPKARPVAFCGARVDAPGCPYCAAHMARAYIRTPRRDAAEVAEVAP